MKYLITGLGNIGREYEKTRHNAGFEILDILAKKCDTAFATKRYGDIAEMKYKGRTLILLKPSTYMNLSGNAVNFWLQAEKIQQEKLLVVLDDFALPAGQIRMKSKGSDGGHNGLKHINAILGNANYARLRFGVGNDFPQGYQVDYVLAQWSKEEYQALLPAFDNAADAILSYVFAGPARTMNIFNTKKNVET